MEKRLLLFFVLSFAVLMIFSSLQRRFGPKPPKKKPGEPVVAQKGAGEASGETGKKTREAERKKAGAEDSKASEESPDEHGKHAGEAAGDDGGNGEEEKSAEPAERRPVFPERIVVLGDYSGKRSPFVAYFNTRGGTLEHVELVARDARGGFRYRELERGLGYLGYLGLEAAPELDGCRVRVVAPGTPAANARPVGEGKERGLRAGDILLRVAGKAIRQPDDLHQVLKMRGPGTAVKIDVSRAGDEEGAARRSVTLEATLDAPPLRLVQLEKDSLGAVRRSLQTTLLEIGELTLRKRRELEGLDMYDAAWELVAASPSSVSFRYRLPKAVLRRARIDGDLAIVKSFRLPRPGGADAGPRFHVEWSLRYEYTGKQKTHVAVRQYGVNGLPLEGWWYARKISPKWGGAGARDVVWRNRAIGHSLLSARAIYKEFQNGQRRQSILTGEGAADERSFSYVGIDTQFFSVAMLPGSPGEDSAIRVYDVQAEAVGAKKTLKGRAASTQNVTFLVDLAPVDCTATGTEDGPLYHFRLFLGPKVPSTLQAYGIRELIEYGWFGFVAKPLSKVLHLFYWLVRNYGIAIILLTVLVRGAMWPLGRKAARNAQVMQLLSPQIKEIKEKYKNDMEKQSKALQELWRRHNFHPLSGCWVMFLQLPIFIGLYRSLSVDIELRQAPLIPGLEWCSNLAGPDQFLYWKSNSLAFLTSETGWLGPYLNLLPIVTIILFLVQQKMFTPPATDEQSMMQQKMMKYMMIFFGVLFFKVPAGLCIYFISSSLWGIMERKLLPKPEVSLEGAGAAAKPGPAEPPRAGMTERLRQMMDKHQDKEKPLDAEERRRRKKEHRKTRRPNS